MPLYGSVQQYLSSNMKLGVGQQSVILLRYAPVYGWSSTWYSTSTGGGG